MPTYMPIEWQGMKICVRPVGKRKLFPIPYFTGSLLKFVLEVRNNSDQNHSFNYAGLLYRLAGVAHQPPVILIQKTGLVEIDRKNKQKVILEIVHVPQPGIYSFELVLNDSYSENLQVQKPMISFEALPKDSTILNLYMIIISALIGALVGFIGGLIIN